MTNSKKLNLLAASVMISALATPAMAGNGHFDLTTPKANDTDNLVWVGHKKNDTDSFAAIIGAAELFGGSPRLVDDLNLETKFVNESCGTSMPARITENGHRVGLVDFNQSTQLDSHVDAKNIVAIVDHHALRDNAVKLGAPISIDIRPWGSASTILTSMYEEQGRTPSKSTACVLLSGLLSDTLVFSSPTTTDYDRAYAKKLAGYAGINDIEAYGMKMLEAKSDLGSTPTAEILTMDYKIYALDGKKVGFGVAETLTPNPLLDRKDDFLKAMKAEKKKSGLDYIYFAVVDTKTTNTTLFVLGNDEAKVAKKAFAKSIKDNEMYLPGVVSRKRQMMPFVKDAIK